MNYEKEKKKQHVAGDGLELLILLMASHKDMLALVQVILGTQTQGPMYARQTLYRQGYIPQGALRKAYEQNTGFAGYGLRAISGPRDLLHGCSHALPDEEDEAEGEVMGLTLRPRPPHSLAYKTAQLFLPEPS